MNEPAPEPLEAVDRLLLSYLDHEAERTDPSPLLERIRNERRLAARKSSGEPAFRRADATAAARRWRRRSAWAAVAAVAVLAFLVDGRSLRPVSAHAAGILRSVRSVHSGVVDRRYRVQFAPDPRYWDVKNMLEGPSDSVLWTRADRFWAACSIGDIKLTVGRDESGVFWITPNRKKGIRFPDQDARYPRELAMICRINAMTVPTLVDDVLADFDLRTEEPSVQTDDATSLIWARLKPGRSHPLLSAALLEIDTRTHVLMRLVLWTVRDGRPKGTVTYSLLESAPQADDGYRLGSHVDPDAVIETQHFRPESSKAKETRS